MTIPNLSSKTQPLGQRFTKAFYQTLKHHFPHYRQDIRRWITDPRNRRCRYPIEDLLWAGVMMFFFRLPSRHAFNQYRKIKHFTQHYTRLLQQGLPHLDTLQHIIPRLQGPECAHWLKSWIHQLLRHKVLAPFKELDNQYVLAIDGTGACSFNYSHCAHCLTRRHKSGKITWLHPILEARLIGRNGFSLPVDVEWMTNPKGYYHKQDCELNAFKRLAPKIKQAFQRTRFVVVVDSLYANAPFMNLCRSYGWDFIISFKPGSLPALYEEIQELKPFMTRQLLTRGGTVQQFESNSDLEYQGHPLTYVACWEQRANQTHQTHFAYLTNSQADPTSIVRVGRLRQKIENEAFNIEKHHGYALGHLFARRDCHSLQIYHYLRLIAQLLHQLTSLWQLTYRLLQNHRTTWVHFYHSLLAWLRHGTFDLDFMNRDPPAQWRYHYPH